MVHFNLTRVYNEKFADAWLSSLRTHNEVVAKVPFHKDRFTLEEAENGGMEFVSFTKGSARTLIRI